MRIFGWQRLNKTDLENLERLREDIRTQQADSDAYNPDHGARIARTLEALVRHHETKAYDDSSQSDRDFTWVRRGFWVVFAYTLVTAWLGWIGHNANIINSTSQRAWIDVTVDPKSVSVLWDADKGVTTNFVVRAVNEGNSPGIETTVFGETAFSEDGITHDKFYVLKRCSETEGVMSKTLFMKGLIDQGITSPIAREEVKDYQKRFGNSHRMNPVNPLYTMYTWRQLIACASYRIVGDGHWHHTCRLFDIYSSLYGLPNREMNFPLGTVALIEKFDADYTD